MRHNRTLQLLSLSLALLLWLTVGQSLERGEGGLTSGTLATRTFESVRVRVLSEPGSPTEIELEPATVTVVIGGRPKQVSEFSEDEIEAYVRLVTGNSLGKRHPVRIQVSGVQVVSIIPQEITIQGAAPKDTFQTTVD